MSEYPDEWRIKAIDGRFAWLDDHADGWQFGETGFLKAICDRIGVDQAVEIGAGDGTDALPLTLGFLYDRGVKTLLFEKDIQRQWAVRQKYPSAVVLGEWSLDSPQVEMISPTACVVVDVDSVDYHVAASLIWDRFPNGPAVLCVEHYDRCAPGADDAEGIPPRWLLGKQLADGGFVVQAVFADMLEAFSMWDYVLVGLSRVNSVYVRNDLLGTLEGC
jgi:hypothetical protein